MTQTLISLSTPLVDIPGRFLANLSTPLIRKLAVAVADHVNKTDPAAATVEDLLNYFPARYEDRSKFVGINELSPGIEAAVEIFVKVSGGFKVGKNRGPKQPPLFVFEITGADAGRTQKPVVVKWFVSGKQAERIVRYYEDRFPRGTRFVAYGKWEWDDRRSTFSLMLNKPEELEILPGVGVADGVLFAPATDREKDIGEGLIEEIGDPEFAPIHNARRVPVYRKLGQFRTKRLREIVHSILQNLDLASVPDDLPADLVERQQLIARAQALTEIHFPPDDSSIADYEMFRSAAHKRLIFDEFFWLSFSMQLLRGERQKEPKGTVIEVTSATKERLKNFLPFELTNAQKKVVGEIFGDLKSDAPMNRLVQGDVGSGKTIVAFLAIFAVMENGYQAALMAPTEILAEQHYRNAARLV